MLKQKKMFQNSLEGKGNKIMYISKGFIEEYNKKAGAA